LDSSDPDYVRMLGKADKALYEAKRLGRNRYFVHPGATA